jgi:hypothetical protein
MPLTKYKGLKWNLPSPQSPGNLIRCVLIKGDMNSQQPQWKIGKMSHVARERQSTHRVAPARPASSHRFFILVTHTNGQSLDG